MNCGILCDILVFIKNIFKFIYETLSIKNRPFLFVGIFLICVLFFTIKFKPKFIYNMLSPFYEKEKEGFSFESLQKLMREEKEKRDEL